MFSSMDTMTAQETVDVKIDGITAYQIKSNEQDIGWAVYIQFSKDFNPAKDAAAYTKTSNYRIINVSNGAFVPVSEAKVAVIPGGTVSRIKLLVPSRDALNAKDLFHLYALNLVFDGAASKNALQHQITVKVDPPPQPPPGSTGTNQPGGNNDNPNEPPKPTWGLKTSTTRNDSDVYVAYDVTSVRHKPTTGTGDVKVSIPFYQNFWKRTSRFSPFVDIKASSNAEADADSLKFGVEWYLPLISNENPESKAPFRIVSWVNTGKIEAPKNFDNINALWESRFVFPSRQLIPNHLGKYLKVYIDPFAGMEIGRNLKSPLEEAEGNKIARLIYGADLIAQIPIENVNLLKGFDFEASYIRRHPLTRELSFKNQENAPPLLLGFGKGPKDYVNSKLTVKVSDFFGPYIGFEWGKQPPNYNLVDHKWTFGLLFKSKVRIK
jgi:hypothetical protein